MRNHKSRIQSELRLSLAMISPRRWPAFLAIGSVFALVVSVQPVSFGAEIATTPEEYVCGPLLTNSTNFLVSLLDPFTGMPYDHLRCACRWPLGGDICHSGGVLPQLADADITTFSKILPNGSNVDWGFVDDLSTGDDPTLLFALKIALDLSPPNTFGGLIWHATVDISRYDRLRIRYRTTSATTKFELKLNSGLEGDKREKTVELPGSPVDGSWRDETYEIATDFLGTDAAHLNFIVLATSDGLAGEPEPILWVDHLAFLADPSQAANCSVVIDCGGDPSCYPDLSKYEPFTGAVNVANALTTLTLLPEVGLLDATEAEGRVARILDSLGGTPRVDGWMQDWHSPSSLMPLSTNRIGSLTDLPQLYAALMVVEESWPSLETTAAAVRNGMIDFTDLFEIAPEGSCPGKLHWAMDLCTGLEAGTLEYYGNDALLGEFLAISSGAAPDEYWSECLSVKGCELRGQGIYRWYTTGVFDCGVSTIPAIETGGPFLQLAPQIYLSSSQLPLGDLTLADSVANMMAAQRDWATSQALSLWGWTNHSDADSCDYRSCDEFLPEVVTPYMSGMGLDLINKGVGESSASNLFAFDQDGAGAPLDTGTVFHEFGLRDAWNQSTSSGRRDNYLFLDTGWLTLGALNACHTQLVRQRFAAHPVASNGYALLGALENPCPWIFGDGFESGDTSAWD
ncbi:MAG: hypothetical protein GY906_31645 [bacterium]|nr:hypothetical protein [bacterium]